MGFTKFFVVSLAIVLASAGKKGGNAVSVEELRELLVSSMQTTIALTALVEQQTQKISDITDFVDQAKEEIKAMKGTIDAMAADDKAQKQIEELVGKLATSEEKMVKEMAALKESLPQKPRKKDVLIVSGEEELREPACARVCAGTTVRSSTNWVDYSTNGIYTDVDISKCGFVTVPTVTTSLEGSTSHWGTTGSSEVYSVTTSIFRIYLVAPVGRAGGANKMHWNVEWIAVGYTC